MTSLSMFRLYSDVWFRKDTRKFSLLRNDITVNDVTDSIANHFTAERCWTRGTRVAFCLHLWLKVGQFSVTSVYKTANRRKMWLMKLSDQRETLEILLKTSQSVYHFKHVSGIRTYTNAFLLEKSINSQLKRYSSNWNQFIMWFLLWFRASVDFPSADIKLY